MIKKYIKKLMLTSKLKKKTLKGEKKSSELLKNERKPETTHVLWDSSEEQEIIFQLCVTNTNLCDLQRRFPAFVMAQWKIGKNIIL